MKKAIKIIILLIPFIGLSQLNIDARIGGNYYWDECSVSNFNDDIAFGLSYEIHDLIRPRLTANIGQLKNNGSHNYQTNYYGVDLDILLNAKSIAGTTYEKWRLYPYVGTGYSVYEDMGTHTLNGGIINTFKVFDNFWLGLEVGAKGIFNLQHPIAAPNYPTRLEGMNAFLYYAGLSASIQLGKSKPRTKPEQEVKTEYIIQKLPILTNEVCCEEEEEPKEYCIGYEHMKTDVDSEQYAMSLKQFFEDVKKYDAKEVQIDCWSCNHGSDKLNCDLSEKRCAKLKKFLEDQFKKYGVEVKVVTRSHCKDTEFVNIHIQMRSCFKIVE